MKMVTLLISNDTFAKFLQGRGYKSNDEYLNELMGVTKLIEVATQAEVVEVEEVKETPKTEEKVEEKPKQKRTKRITKKKEAKNG